MRRLVHISFVFLLLGFALNGCRQSAAERRLVEIDTLIARGTYDSALALLRAIDTTTLSRDELAYHGLLMAHAAYKAYDSAYFDTTWITRARQAYADGGPYDRHIRTLLYSGCVAEDLGNPLAAMKWFKLTELDARLDDHFHKGYALMAMGSLYQNEYKNKGAINKYLKAAQHLSLSGDTSYLLFCDLQLYRNYCLFNADSAEYYGNEVRSLARAANNQQYYYQSLQVKVADLFNKKRYAEAIPFFQTVISEAPQFADYACWLYGAISYLNVRNLDSARICLSHAFQPESLSDSLLYYQWKSAFYAYKGDSVASVRFEKIAGERSELEILNNRESRLKPVELKCEKEYENAKKHSVWFYVSLAVVFLLLVVSIVWPLFLRNKKAKNEINDLQQFISSLEQTNKKLASEKASNANPLSQEMLASLTAAYRDILTRMRKEAGKKGEDRFDETIGKALTPGYFSNLHQYVDYAHHGLATSMKDSEILTDKEINIVCMRLCRLPNSIIATYAGLHTTSNVARMLNAIASKYYGENGKFNDFLNE